MSANGHSNAMGGSAYERGALRLRSDPAREQFVRWCYLDEPLAAARRFAASEEFAEVCRILSLGKGGKRILDVGCGNGIASFAFASRGCKVVALEPNPSAIVGTGTMADLQPNLPAGSIQVVDLPVGGYRDMAGGFDVVYLRQVAHHFPVLEDGLVHCAELLKPGGVLLMTREHVADTPAEVEMFKQKHALVQDGVEEQAYPAARYRNALIRAGLTGVREWGPFDSAINFYPSKPEDVRAKARNWICRRWGGPGGFLFRRLPAVERWALHRMSRGDRTPGRLFTFLGVKMKTQSLKACGTP